MVDKNNVTEAKPHLNLPIKPKCIVFLNLTTKCHITGISVEKRENKNCGSICDILMPFLVHAFITSDNVRLVFI